MWPFSTGDRLKHWRVRASEVLRERGERERDGPWIEAGWLSVSIGMTSSQYIRWGRVFNTARRALLNPTTSVYQLPLCGSELGSGSCGYLSLRVNGCKWFSPQSTENLGKINHCVKIAWRITSITSWVSKIAIKVKFSGNEDDCSLQMSILVIYTWGNDEDKLS